VKLIRKTKSQLLFHLGTSEKLLLCQLLQLYPIIPAAHQKLTKNGTIPDAEASQRMLDEALAEQRVQSRAKVQAFLAEKDRFQSTEHGLNLTLKCPEMEWLLQTLNDIRVGSWVRLGSPESLEIAVLDETTAPHYWAMEVAGHFQMRFLAALESRMKSPPRKPGPGT
jgi:hypothetical protein